MAGIPLRDDRGTTPPAVGVGVGGGGSACPVCSRGFIPAGRQQFCSSVCRKRAFRARRGLTAVRVVVPAGAPRRERTVYECPDCGQRQAGVQWCADCVRPTRVAGLGGDCPHCGEPVTAEDLGLTGQDRR
jgi:hypothetical protein